MQITARPTAKTVDYDHHAGVYARNRRVHPGVAEALLLDDEAFARGLRRLENDLAKGPIPCVSLYTMIWGTTPLT